MPILSNFPSGSGSGAGLTLAAVSNITTQVASGKVYVKWTDPADLVVAESTLATWGGTLLVRKAGSMPTSRRDGTIILDSKTRDAYKSSYFCDSGLSNGTTYYYKFFPYTTSNSYTDSEDDEFSATPTVQVSGITSWNVTGMSASSEAGDGKMTVKWTDPASTITTDGLTLATWASTTIVVKAGSYPTSKDDSNAAYKLKVTTRNQYSSSALTITGLTNGTKYYIAFFPETTESGINDSTSQRTTGTANRITISSVPSQSSTLTYSGSSQSPSWSNYNTTYMTIGGTTSATNAGSYTATFTPKGDYRWSDGTTAAKSITWSIGRATISSVPSQSGSLTYTGSAQSPTWSNYDSSKMSIGGTTSSTNAGTFTATFTPNSNYQWSDSTTTAKSVNWTMAKATGSLSLSATSVALNSSTTSKTVTVTRAGDGTITATSSNTSVATVSVSGTTLTIKSVNTSNGSATITVKVAAGTNHTAPSNKTISVTASFVSTTLNDNTWATISDVASKGTGANYWSVGQCKAVSVSGTVGTRSISGTYYVYILGFAHNGASNTIDFGTFKTALTGGTDICLIDGKYNSDSTNGTKYFNMNHSSNTNSGGWKGCDLRYDVLGSTNTNDGNAGTTTATSPVSGTLMAALPSDLRAVMKPMTIYTDNTGGASNTAAGISTSVDYLPLLAEFEIFGSRTYANQYEQNYQKQYTYYSSGNSKVKYKHNSTGSAAWWWGRSPSYHYSLAFCLVYTNGSASSSDASYSYGVAPAFRV